MSPQETAVDMGIRIGPTIVREDWYSAVEPNLLPVLETLDDHRSNLDYTPRGCLVIRKNRITMSAGDDHWPVIGGFDTFAGAPKTLQ